MSSFICDAKHFNSIASNLKTLIAKNDFYIPYSLKEKFPKTYSQTEGYQKEVDAVIDELRVINVLANHLQYKHHYEGTLDAEIASSNEQVKEKTSVKTLSNLGLLNALKCLDYQIEIHHIEELRELTETEANAMLFLTEMTNRIAMHICSKLPDDSTNTWSIS